MPQELRVVCCYQCRIFQSDIVKKAKKWTCKMCGSKQSLVKEYARGSGKECRLLVQQLSGRAHQKEQLEQQVVGQMLAGDFELPELPNPVQQESERLICHVDNTKNVTSGASKWEQFRVKEEEDDEDDENQDLFKSSDGVRVNDCRERIEQRDAFDLIRESNPRSTEPVGNSWNPKFSFKTFQSKQSLETPTAKNAVPLMNFHQMDKKDKKQFKWESRNMAKRSLDTASKSQTMNNMNSQSNSSADSLFSQKNNFEPKSSKQVESNAFDMNSTTKRKIDMLSVKTPLMSFEKKSKWDSFAGTAEEDSSDAPEVAIVSQRDLRVFQNNQKDNQTTASTSKWSKFVVQEEDDGDEGFL